MKHITQMLALTAAFNLAAATAVMADESANAPANNSGSSEVKDARKDLRKSRRELRKAKKHQMKKEHSQPAEAASSAPVESTPSK